MQPLAFPCLDFGDFNNDGESDLAVVNSGSNNVSILLGNGEGVFSATITYNAGNGPVSAAAGDGIVEFSIGPY